MPQLKPYQERGVAYLRDRRRAFLWDEMGLGKSAQALMALPDKARALIVCPAIVKTVWADETRKWRPDLRASVLSGRRAGIQVPGPGEIFILNYEILPSHYPERLPVLFLIADEAHYLKSPKAKRTRFFRFLAANVLAEGGAVWLLTGTPMTREPPDLWHVFQAVGAAAGVFGGWQRFRDGFNAREIEIKARGRTVKKTVWGRGAPWVADAVRAHSLRRTRAEVLPELPEKIRTTVRVEVARLASTEAAAALGSDPERTLDAYLERGEDLPKPVATLRRDLATAKIPALLELLRVYEEQARPVVVFSAHRAPIDALARRPGWSVILGGDRATARAAAVTDFQEGRLRGLGATIGAAGVGITLTRAADAIFVDLDWTPAANVQAEARLLRIGQTRSVAVTVLEALGEPIDGAVNRVLARKQEIFESAVRT